MDAEQLDEIRRWAERLRDAESAEQRAAGRALLLLADEVERLRGQLADTPAAAPATAPPPRTRPSRTRRLLGLGALAALLGIGALLLASWVAAPSLAAQGPTRRLVGAGELPGLAFSVAAGDARWRLDGVDVTASAGSADGRSTLTPPRLADGGHVVSVAATGGFLFAHGRRTWRFVVDTRPPALAVPRVVAAPRSSTPRLAGRLETDATLTLDGRPVALRDGRFRVALPRSGALLVATDPAGNEATRVVRVELAPRRPPRPVRAVHVTFYGWRDPQLRAGVLRLLDEHRIDAVELDLKDESGTVGFASGVPLARAAGAEQPLVALAAAVRELHARGARVIGRLVCFRDPIAAAAAWKAGRRSEVIQTPDGRPYAGYGGFTNFAAPAVRRYQVAVAVAAARLGVDEILYDYVRRPDGPLSSMRFPGLVGTPEAAIVSFLAETRRALAPYPKVFLGASVFGVAATRPLEVAQDVPAMARELDYVAPMVYPSHWAPGEYGVASPNSEPYAIVLASLRDFREQVRGTGARVVPWLQDFSLGVAYGPAEVRAEIRAARDAGSDEWILWDAAVTYTAAALDPLRPPASPG